MKYAQTGSSEPTPSRSSGNVDGREEAILALAETDPRGAMLMAAGYYGDGSCCSAPACNMAVAINYGRYLKTSQSEREYVHGLPGWGRNVPDMSNELLVAFRLRYGAWRTKTAAYERARVHTTAIRAAYEQGIEPRQVRAYLETFSLEGLYAWALEEEGRSAIRKNDLIDCRGSEDLPGVAGLKRISEEVIRQDPTQSHSGNGSNREPLVSVPSPRKPPRPPKYDGPAPDVVLEICVSSDDFGSLMPSDSEFLLHCRPTPNGRSNWKRIDGHLT